MIKIRFRGANALPFLQRMWVRVDISIDIGAVVFEYKLLELSAAGTSPLTFFLQLMGSAPIVTVAITYSA